MVGLGWVKHGRSGDWAGLEFSLNPIHRAQVGALPTIDHQAT